MKNTEMTLRKDRRILDALASGKYTVTPDGRVFNNDYKNTGERKELKYGKDYAGYLRVHLGRMTGVRVARMVALAFLGEPSEYKEPNHKNGIKDDNRAANLEWVTPKQNCQHARDTGLRPAPIGDLHGRSTITNEQASEIRKLISKGGLTSKGIAEIYGVNKHVVDNIRQGRTWRHV